MSLRVTRAAARAAAQQVQNPSSPPANLVGAPQPKTRSQKRRASNTEADAATGDSPAVAGPSRRNKRQKLQEAEPSPPSARAQPRRNRAKPSTMSDSGYVTASASSQRELLTNESHRPPENLGESEELSAQPSTAKRKGGRNKKSTEGEFTEPKVVRLQILRLVAETSTPTQSNSRRPKKPNKKNTKAGAKETEDNKKSTPSKGSGKKGNRDPSSDSHVIDDQADEDDDDDMADEDNPMPSRSDFLSGMPSGFAQSARALIGGMMPHAGMGGQLRMILENLRQHEDPSTQRTALEELAGLLLMANEDSLNGQFSPDSFVKELVIIMQGEGVLGPNPEMMLLACRCIANLIEALPQAAHSVVTGGAVPILCQKLIEIDYIDLAEQALIVSVAPCPDYTAMLTHATFRRWRRYLTITPDRSYVPAVLRPVSHSLTSLPPRRRGLLSLQLLSAVATCPRRPSP